MDYKYISGYEFVVIRSRWNGDLNYDFFKYLSDCGIKYYLFHNSHTENPRRKYYVYCEKKFLLTRMKYDF